MEKLNRNNEKTVAGNQPELFIKTYSYLVRATNDEVYNPKEDVIKSNDELRKAFIAVADSTGKSKNMISYEWLFAGIYDRLPNNQLKSWAALKDPKGSDEKVQVIAKYLLEKKQAAAKKQA